MRACRFCFALLLIAFWTYEAGAQYVVRPFYGGYRPYGFYGYGGTVYGSYAAGMGQLIQAQGAANQMNAVAATQMQEAYKLSLDNKLKAAQTNYQLQKINAQQRAEQERYAKSLRAPAPPVKIPRLTSSQLDPVTGEINWPPILREETYQAQRAQLQAMFTRRAADPMSVSYSEVQQAAMSLRNKLDEKIRDYATADFFSARHFLTSLVEETRYTGLETPEQTAAAK